MRSTTAPSSGRACSSPRSRISATGGHGDLNGFSPYLTIAGASGIADGIDEIRKRVRENIKRGADLIKVLAGAGVLSRRGVGRRAAVLAGGD